MALPLSYNWRNLFVRKLSTSLTFLCVATVVAVLAVLLSFAEGIRASLAASGLPLNVIVLKPGATAESTSIIRKEEMDRVIQAPGIARDKADQSLISTEISVQTSIPRAGPGGKLANVPVRGVDDIAFAVHSNVKIIHGRPFRQGQLEFIVGKAAAERFANLQIGSTLAVGKLLNRVYTVVGIFDAGGSALESEIWGPRTMIENSYNWLGFSSAMLRVTDAGAAQAAIDYIRGPVVQLNAKRETEYYEDVSKTTAQIVTLTSILIAIMAIGAAFAVANTMYAAVDSRRREIAMLRTLGFTRGSIITSFVIESLVISVLACTAGLCAALLLRGRK